LAVSIVSFSSQVISLFRIGNEDFGNKNLTSLVLLFSATDIHLFVQVVISKYSLIHHSRYVAFLFFIKMRQNLDFLDSGVIFRNGGGAAGRNSDIMSGEAACFCV